MADFESDTDESAVEELISQARELSVLEQVSKINSSGFTDSALPTDLESRFRKLKSFPVSRPKTQITDNGVHQKSLSNSRSGLGDDSIKGKGEGGSVSDEENGVFSVGKVQTDGKGSSFSGEREISLDGEGNGDGISSLEKQVRGGYGSSPCNSSDSSVGEEIFWPKEEKKPSLKSKSVTKSGSFGCSLASSNSLRDSPSPPRKSGCLWCSPKRDSKKKSRKNWDLAGMDNRDDFLSDLGTFSLKEQQKMLKKAMKEEERFNKQAEKIVKMVKQASARMSFHGTEHDLSDDECGK